MKTPPKSKTNPNALMAQMQKMQEDMAKAQDELKDESITVTSGGGAVSIVISGHQRVESITINPELLDPEEVELLQDMLVAAVNQAIEQSQAMSAQRMEGITGGMGDLDSLLGGLPGM
ncbi:MAG: YbaB/EbfC family nucleoid-associated protein [Ardenticatenaceae bacterium]|nr:YbaB/EbfC family nucleoid-associated protein [Ardenticatenaceae bacterium]